MAEALFDSQNSGSSDWATDIAFALDARTVHVVNNGAYPVRVRFGAGAATSGAATGKVAAGASKTWTFQTSQRKDRVALYGVGGVSSCDVEVSEDVMALAGGGASGSLVLAGLSSSTPAAPTASGTAGVAATAARGDHAHPNNLSDIAPAGLSVTPAAGVALDASRSDHRHGNNLSDNTPAGSSAAGSAGVAITGARSDHAHPRGVITPSLAAESGEQRRLTLTCTVGGAPATGPVEIRLFSSTGANNAISQNLELITGTTAAWPVAADGAGANDSFIIVTPNGSGVIEVDLVDETSSLSGNMYVTAFQPSTGGYAVVTAPFA